MQTDFQSISDNELLRANIFHGSAALFTGTGPMGHGNGDQIQLEDFANSYTIFAFDLSPDLCDGVFSTLQNEAIWGWNDISMQLCLILSM